MKINFLIEHKGKNTTYGNLVWRKCGKELFNNVFSDYPDANSGIFFKVSKKPSKYGKHSL